MLALETNVESGVDVGGWKCFNENRAPGLSGMDYPQIHPWISMLLMKVFLCVP